MTTGVATVAPIAGLTAQRYRRAMGRIPTSVVVASTMVDGEPVGMVIGTFNTVSLDPPLVGFFGDRGSATFAEIRHCERVTFNVLSQDDLPTCEQFARPRDDRFRSVEWHRSSFGTPHLDRSVLAIDTVVREVRPAGDHDLLLAQVEDVTLGDPLLRPLVFQGGRLARLDPAQRVSGELWQLGWDH